MKNMFVISFVILFVFIMVLCAIQPICFANALETDQSYTLTIVDTEVIAGADNKVYLMLDNETPLTPRYLIDNPDYFVNTKSAKDYTLYAELSSNKVSLRAVSTGSYTIDKTLKTTLNYYASQHGDEFLDAPLYLISSNDTVYTISSAWNYTLTLLEKMALFSSHILNSVQTIINFIMDNPLVILSTCLAFISSIIFIAKRNSRAG